MMKLQIKAYLTHIKYIKKGCYLDVFPIPRASCYNFSVKHTLKVFKPKLKGTQPPFIGPHTSMPFYKVQTPDFTQGYGDIRDYIVVCNEAEVMRVYGSLGIVVNEIARWLRKQGVRCQSNHPMGGLSNTPSLAGKAGMGWQGRSGLLIAPEYGPRVRIAPVFIEHKYFDFTDNRAHDWIEKYCEQCRLCEKACPAHAIYAEKVVTVDKVPGISTMRACIDREKCFEFFLKTMGCSVCVKACPFSRSGNAYNQLKAIIENSAGVIEK